MLDVEPAVAELLIELAYVAGLIEQRTVSRPAAKYAARRSSSRAPPPRRGRRAHPVRCGSSPAPGSACRLLASVVRSPAGRRQAGPTAEPAGRRGRSPPSGGGRARGRPAPSTTGPATTLTDLAAALYWAQPQPWLRDGPRQTHAADRVGVDGGRAARHRRRRQADVVRAGADRRDGDAESRRWRRQNLAPDVVHAAGGSDGDRRRHARPRAAHRAAPARRRRVDGGGDDVPLLGGLAAAGVRRRSQRRRDHVVPRASRRQGRPAAARLPRRRRRPPPRAPRVSGDAGSFVTSDDPAVLADVSPRPPHPQAGLRLLAPTVAVSPPPIRRRARGAACRRVPADGRRPRRHHRDRRPGEAATESPADAAATASPETGRCRSVSPRDAPHAPSSTRRRRPSWPPRSSPRPLLTRPSSNRTLHPPQRGAADADRCRRRRPPRDAVDSRRARDLPRRRRRRRTAVGRAVERRRRPHRRVRIGRTGHRLDPTRADQHGDRPRCHRRRGRDGTGVTPSRQLGAAALGQEAAVSDGPLVVQSDKTLLLEIDHPLAEECRLAIAGFAELESAPEHIHTYRITPLVLWNAGRPGVEPSTSSTSCCGTAASRYRTALLDRRRRHDRPLRPPRACGPDRRPRAARRRPGRARRGRALQARVPAARRAPRPHRSRCRWPSAGRLKQALLTLGWPADDQAGYVDGAPLSGRCSATPAGSPLRPYQTAAPSTRSSPPAAASIVLPCGAGKTIVGVGAMARARRAR